ncbi:OprD family outer membrane porin [Candidatus Sororendozoicomonas aggregata]|uniref:OprD family outer membrane porin n=1 Tax=Candidatus Sororendozoicomonas aggregata TaxID=3073239 RepID=UPI002ED070ED
MQQKQLLLTRAAISGTICAIIASTAQGDLSQLFEEGSLNGKLRSIYFDIDKKEYLNGSNTKTTGAWTGSLWLDAKSGYAWDVIGFDASYYGVQKLSMANDNKRENGGGGSKELLNDNNEGVAKLGQAYIKAKLGDDAVGGQFRAGRQLIYNALVSSSRSRSVPSTWFGYNLVGKVDAINYGLVYVDQMSLRNQAGFHKLVSFDDRPIDHIIGAQLGYNADGVKLQYRNAFSKDFLKAHNGTVGYTFDLAQDTRLTLDARYYVTKKDGHLWNGTAWGSPAFDDKAENTSLNARLALMEWTLVASVSKTKAKSSLGLGRYYYDFGKNTHGIWDVPTTAFAEDFFYDGEQAYTVGGQYDFTKTGLNGLTLGYFFTYGHGIQLSNGDKGREHEHDFLAIYAFNQAPLKGLSVKAQYGLYKNSDSVRQEIGYGKRNDLRMWLDYNFVAF